MSDTIIMYENGKAVGGEGHPTNADEITFDNTGTDLVSEEVESAIKEVNAKFDRGSVSVTADGVKTFGQLFNELYALIDRNKLTNNTIFISASAANDVLYIFHLMRQTATDVEFLMIETTANSTNTYNHILKASDSKRYTSVIAASGTTISEGTSGVPTSGSVLTINY